MRYKNPIIPGFYPDPSVCRAEGKYYLVCSSFQYFPGVPLFESEDLVNWKQIGHVLTRPSQVQLERVNSSGGVFASTIRYHDGTFYMVTTNDTTHQNFYVSTNDIYGEWSEPVFVDQGGIDPSLLFDGDKVYFISNGADDFGNGGIVQCEIDIRTGRKLTPSRAIWSGSGGRYLESPHMYKLDGGYYLMAAEGGTEYGHMITYARSDDPWGPFVGYEKNPVLTNRNLGGFEIQGVGHGDLVQAPSGEWFIIHLGFRQIGRYDTFHHIGREVFMTPVHFDSDGFFTAGENGTTGFEYEIEGDFVQESKKLYTFENTDHLDWVYLRKPHMENYLRTAGGFELTAGEETLDDPLSPTFVGIRQRAFGGRLRVHLEAESGETGVCVYMDEKHHYELALAQTEGSFEVILRLNIGCAKCISGRAPIKGSSADLIITMNNYAYGFSAEAGGEVITLGSADTKYVSTEVAGGFTGVLLALYAQKGGKGSFSDFGLSYE